MIRIKDLEKEIGNKKILSNINLNLEEGQFISIIGPNGAGKSTLISIIARLMRPENDVVFFEETDINKIKNSELAKQISILKQSNDNKIRFKVRELIAFGRFPYSKGLNTKEDEQMIDTIIDYFQINHLKDLYTNELSGGQLQIVYIAMIAVQDTKYVFLDEPLNNLDIKHAKTTMRILKRYAKDFKKTIVVVIHDINFAASYSDQIIAIKEGKINIIGTPDEVINAHTLKEIYEVDFNVCTINNKKLCMYY